MGGEKYIALSEDCLNQGSPPHWREKSTGKGEKGEAAGSPPRGRGKDTQFPVKVAQDGITPAWAGKSVTN